MKTVCLTMFAAALESLAALTNAQDNEMTTAVVPTDDGRGVAACVSVSFGDLRELPVKTVQCLWSLVVCVTQPIHPYHYVRDDQGKVVTNSNGGNKKVWLPFYRLWGEHQGDSVVGIVYDNRGTNGIVGSCWFAGYGKSGWQDKAGKTTALLALLLIDRNNNYSGLWNVREPREVDIAGNRQVPSGEQRNEETGSAESGSNQYVIVNPGDTSPAVPSVTAPQVPAQGGPVVPPVISPAMPTQGSPAIPPEIN